MLTLSLNDEDCDVHAKLDTYVVLIYLTIACMEDDVCHLEGSKWWSECTEKTCEKQEDGSVNVIDVTGR